MRLRSCSSSSSSERAASRVFGDPVEILIRSAQWISLRCTEIGAVLVLERELGKPSDQPVRYRALLGVIDHRLRKTGADICLVADGERLGARDQWPIGHDGATAETSIVQACGR